MTRDPYRITDPYMPAGPDGPLLLPPAVARLLWPAVAKHLEELRDRGALETVRAAGPAIRRWEQAYMAGAGFHRGTPDSDGPTDGQRLPHDDDLSTAQAAERLGTTTQWVNRLAARGDLDSRMVGRTRVVSARSVEEHRRRQAS